jgi:predicted lysophospholipase L1 biosynthesis ABC-type transport system permease subunit
MENSNELEKLDEIRNLMMRSSRFISLSGLSGVIAGLAALFGAAAAYYYLELSQPLVSRYSSVYDSSSLIWTSDAFWFCLVDAGLVLAVSLIAGIILTR